MGPRESVLGHFNSFCVSVELGARPLFKLTLTPPYSRITSAMQLAERVVRKRSAGFEPHPKEDLKYREFEDHYIHR